MEAKEAFDSVCAQIAERYKEDGWKYSKSSHWMTKKDKNFTYKVLFYTSWNNRSEEYVVFYGAFGIYSNKGKNCFTVISTQDCKVPKGELHWNVAKEDAWEMAIEEFMEWLNTTGIPIIEECTNNLNGYVEKVVKHGFYPPLGYTINMDFVIQFGSKELAEEAAKRYYESQMGRMKESTAYLFRTYILCGKDFIIDEVGEEPWKMVEAYL